MIGDNLYRAYIGKKPVTTVWRRTKEEAEEDIIYLRDIDKPNFHIIGKDVNSVVKNRKKTGFRGLL